jgi:hypothetical protein
MSRGKKLNRIFTMLDQNFDIYVDAAANFVLTLGWLCMKPAVQNGRCIPTLHLVWDWKTVENLD